MYSYRIYNINVASDIILPSAMKADTEDADVVIRFADLSSMLSEAEKERCNMSMVNNEGEEAWMIQNISKEACFFNIYSVGAFRISSGSMIEYMKTVDVDTYQLEQWILNRCIPLIMVQRKSILFHGSALLHNGYMIYIGGESGSGKSTLTDSLLKDGMSFAADDTIHVRINDNNVQGIGAYPLRRLCGDVITDTEKEHLIYIPDGSKEKYACDMKDVWPDDFSTLKYMFIIVPKEISHVSIEEFHGLGKIQKLIESLYFGTAYIKLGTMSSIMRDLLTIADNVRIFAINRPIGKMTVEEQKKLIRNYI